MDGQSAARLARVAKAPGRVIGFVAAFALLFLASDDVGFGDAAEIGSAGFELGVAHPTGFAFDLLVLRLFSFLPIGHIALRQNLAVGAEAAAALGLLAALTAEIARQLGVRSAFARFLAACVAVCALLSFRTFVATAVAVEVYSLALAAGLLAAYAVVASERNAGLACLALGFAAGMHVTAVAFALLALSVVWLQRGVRAGARFLFARLPIVLAGAAIVLYLPLASRRQPSLDWGDPETPARLLAHLSAARIRSAFQGEMLASDPAVSLGFIAQLGELWPLLPLGLFALTVGLTSAGRRRRLLLAVLGWFACDAAYATWVNPMGVIDRQVGHMAAACVALLGGIGVALVCELSARRARALGRVALTLAALLGAGLLARFPRAELASGYAASELFGSGGPLADVAARAVLVCASDDACAGALFALDIERVRPDVTVVPAQHLWDATVLRRLSGIPAIAGLPASPEPAPSERRALASSALRGLLERRGARPVRLESPAPLRWAGLDLALSPSMNVPYLQALTAGDPQPSSPLLVTRRLERLRVARLPKPERASGHARQAWSRVFGTLGAALLGTDDAIGVLRSAVRIAPERAAAWTNLAVALETRGELDGAIECVRHAIELAPGRATPWLNLARLELARNGQAGARRVLELARRAGVADERMRALARTLEVTAPGP